MSTRQKYFEEFLLWRALKKVQQIVLVFCSVTIILSVVLSVFMRYVFKSSLYGIEEIITLIALWLYFIGGIYGTYENTHISADILSSSGLSTSVKKIFSVIAAIISVFCSLILAKWGIDYIRWSLKVGGATTSLRIPLILSQIPLSICFIGMLVYDTYYLVNTLLGRQPKIEKIEIAGDGGEVA